MYILYLSVCIVSSRMCHDRDLGHSLKMILQVCKVQSRLGGAVADKAVLTTGSDLEIDRGSKRANVDDLFSTASLEQRE